MAQAKKSTPMTSGNLAVNRKATHDYKVLEKFEAGIELFGTEVKVLRNGEGGLLGSWCKIDDKNELWLMQVRIPPYCNLRMNLGFCDAFLRLGVENGDEKRPAVCRPFVCLVQGFCKGGARVLGGAC
jgi:hypothetical protein